MIRIARLNNEYLQGILYFGFWGLFKKKFV